MQEQTVTDSNKPISTLTPIGCSYYVKSDSLTVDHYQKLVDRGWRRSGSILYKPDVRHHCCPHYTIRLPAASYKPQKDHRQSLNRWNRYVLGDKYTQEAAKLYPKTKSEKRKNKQEFDLIESIHESEYAFLKRPPEPEHKLEVTLESNNFTEEKYKLFENYQRSVHKDSTTRSGFRNFLCNSPLQREPFPPSIEPVGNWTNHRMLGSFHQCYRLDGRLIAMAVLDLLPHCVSGVYFIYHDDFSKWSFGKLSAMREAALAIELGLQYYYMGYYIHSCVKMRYKGDYKPQYFLDPETNEFAELTEDVKALMEAKKYVSLAEERRLAETREEQGNEDCDYDQRAGKDQYYRKIFKRPKDAADAGLSLLQIAMPGVIPLKELRSKIDLGDMPLLYGKRRDLVMENLVLWDEDDILRPRTITGAVAELAACVGPEVAKEAFVKI